MDEAIKTEKEDASHPTGLALFLTILFEVTTHIAVTGRIRLCHSSKGSVLAALLQMTA